MSETASLPTPDTHPYPSSHQCEACDRCGHSDDGTPIALAAVRAIKGKLKLFFCAHCRNMYEPALVGDGWILIDITEKEQTGG